MRPPSGEYVGTSFEGRNSWEAWKAAMPLSDLRNFLNQFLTHHEDDVAQVRCVFCLLSC